MTWKAYLSNKPSKPIKFFPYFPDVTLESYFLYLCNKNYLKQIKS